MNEAQINDILIKARKASDILRKQGRVELAVAILQFTSMFVLPYLPKSHPVTCRTCSKQLHVGLEIEFYNHTGMCYSCDSAYVDCMEEIIYE